jgi:SulP family sulfate permease
MEAALIAGVISALLTYAIQSVAYPKPIRGSMTAATLRSSEWNRSPRAFAILDSKMTGRQRIFVLQFQGHLFFGNVSLFNVGVKDLVGNKPLDKRPCVVIMDFTLVLGIDSSAAQAIVKLRDSLKNQFGINLIIFVPGSAEGFPCEIDLSDELNSREIVARDKNGSKNTQGLKSNLAGSHVCDDMDQALIFAEDSLIAMVDSDLLYENIKCSFLESNGTKEINNLEEEKSYAIALLLRKCPGEERKLVKRFFSYFSRELYKKGDVLWKQDATSDSAKLLVSGDLIASLENEAGTTETISIGSIIGESGLVENFNRNSTVHVLEDTVLYSLSRESWETLKENDPKCAHLLYAIVVRYLTLRCQHVSNRIFETRCLPI